MRHVLFALFLIPINVFGQGSDVPLGEIATKLKAEVQAFYKEPIRISLSDLDPYLGGTSDVASDGTPTIRISSALQSTAREVIIVHELHHLRLRALKFPAPIILPSETVAALEELLPSINENVISGLEHAIFFPEMKADGFDPIADNVDFYKKMLHTKTIPQYDDRWPIEALGLIFFFFDVELGSLGDSTEGAQVLQEYQRFIRAGGHYDAIAAIGNASAAAQLVRRETIKTPEQEAITIIKVLNCLLSEFGTFSLFQVRPVERGEFQQQVILVSLNPWAQPQCQ